MRIRFLPAALCIASLVFLADARADDARLNRDQLQAITAGKTHREFKNGKPFRSVYYAPDGRYAEITADNSHWLAEQRWDIESDPSHHDYLCTLQRPCFAFTPLPGGKFMRSGGFTVEVLDGDADHVVARVASQKAAIDARNAAQNAPPPGDYLSGDEVRALLTGKTTIESDPRDRLDTAGYFFFASDGIAYFHHGHTIWRGRWLIDGNRVCLEHGSWPCASFRRAAGGKVTKEYGHGASGTRRLQLADGDPNNVAALVSNSYPYNRAQASPGAAVPAQPSFLENTTVR